MKKLLVNLVVLAVLVASFAGCAPKPSATTTALKVGVIYIGVPGDGGYTKAHDDGIQAAKQALGSKVEFVFREKVNDSDANATNQAISALIDEGCKVIIGTSYGFMDPMVDAAKANKNIIFLHCSGYKTDTNMGTYFGRMEQTRYLSGIAAGKATKNNKIGMVAAFPIPEVIRAINAFTLGARSVNPSAEVYVKWTNTWYDPTVEKEAAKALLAQGVDVMAQYQDTTEPVLAAEAAGAYSVGSNSPMGSAAPKGYLTSPLWVWGGYYTEALQQILDGTWKSGAYYEGFNKGVVKLDTFGPSVAQDTKDLIASKTAAIKDGSFNVFQGPIADQTGAVKVPEGTTMTDAEILSFNWFVQGVVGVIPKS